MEMKEVHLSLKMLFRNCKNGSLIINVLFNFREAFILFSANLVSLGLHLDRWFNSNKAYSVLLSRIERTFFLKLNTTITSTVYLLPFSLIATKMTQIQTMAIGALVLADHTI